MTFCTILLDRIIFLHLFSGKTNTLSHYVMREFERWSKDKKGEYDHLLDNYIRHKAFKLGIRFHLTNFEFIAKAFRLNHPGNEYFISDIRVMLENKKYKEVSISLPLLSFLLNLLFCSYFSNSDWFTCFIYLVLSNA